MSNNQSKVVSSLLTAIIAISVGAEATAKSSDLVRVLSDDGGTYYLEKGSFRAVNKFRFFKTYFKYDDPKYYESVNDYVSYIVQEVSADCWKKQYRIRSLSLFDKKIEYIDGTNNGDNGSIRAFNRASYGERVILYKLCNKTRL